MQSNPICYNCQQRGHIAKNCTNARVPRPAQVRQLDWNNLTEDDVKFTIGQWQQQKKAKDVAAPSKIANLDVNALSEADKTLLAHKLGFS
jgi:hypothetical protein